MTKQAPQRPPRWYLIAGWLVFSFVSLGARANDAMIEIARYFDIAGTALYQAQKTAIALHAQQPQAATALEGSLKYWNADVATQRIAAVLGRRIGFDEANRLTRFFRTPVGMQLGTILKTRKEQPALVAAVSQMPPAERQQAELFLNSPGARDVFAVIDSIEAHAVWTRYGEELMCMHLSKDDPKALAIMQGQGKCVAR
jgi:hypothetical protein